MRPRTMEIILTALRELLPAAQRVNGGTPADHPDRQASVAFTALLNLCVEDGVTAYRLGKELGVTTNAIKFRLARHGYGEAPPSVEAAQGKYKGTPTYHARSVATHCRHGHESSPENTYISPRGIRQCRRCVNEASKRYKARQAGAA